MTALLHAVREGHTDVAMALLDAGYHVVVEAPMSCTLDGADQLIAADAGMARGDGTRLISGEGKRVLPGVDDDEIIAQPVHLEERKPLVMVCLLVHGAHIDLCLQSFQTRTFSQIRT